MYVLRKSTINFKLSIDDINKKITNLPQKMSREEAGKYYSKKFKDYFDSQLTCKDFEKVEDYFGYFEAMKIKKCGIN